MKALPFIEYFKEIRMTNIDIQGQDRIILDKIKITSTFYSQDFKPELITELFDNVTAYGLRDYIITNEKSIYMYSNQNYRIYCFRRTENFPRPKTLDNFISDCQRSGIELIWKESIVDKYFK